MLEPQFGLNYRNLFSFLLQFRILFFCHLLEISFLLWRDTLAEVLVLLTDIVPLFAERVLLFAERVLLFAERVPLFAERVSLFKETISLLL
jgi:hypothetical protein